MSGHAKMPPASHQVSATSLKFLIQQIHPHVRIERDLGMCIARDLYELWAGAPTPACLWPARRTRKRKSSHVVHDTAPIPGIIIPGARGKDLHPRSSCQRVVEGVVHLPFPGSRVTTDQRAISLGNLKSSCDNTSLELRSPKSPNAKENPHVPLTYGTSGERFRIQQLHRYAAYSVSLWHLFRFGPGALLLQLRQLFIFAAAAARAPTPPRPLFGRREAPKKERRWLFAWA